MNHNSFCKNFYFLKCIFWIYLLYSSGCLGKCVTMALTRVIQETQKEGALKALKQDGIEKLYMLTASKA